MPILSLFDRLACSYGKISSPVTENPAGQAEISVTGSARLLINIKPIFTKEIGVRQDHGNRTSPVEPHRAHMKRLGYFITSWSWEGFFILF